MAYDTSKMPPGLLKEIPDKKGRSAKTNALRRRLESSKKDANKQPGMK